MTLGSSHLRRFQPEAKYLVIDLETEGLTLGFTRPWEVSFLTASLKDGITSIHTAMIRWPDLNVSPEAAYITRFDPDRYQREAKDPREEWAALEPLLYDPQYTIVGHNVLGFDSLVLNTWRALLGMKKDYSFVKRLIDTHLLSKGMKLGLVPDITTPLDFLRWQHRVNNRRTKKGEIKTKLGIMCKEMGLDYDETKAHGAQYDIDRNWALFKELVWRVEL